jgi:hypothetical protein
MKNESRRPVRRESQVHHYPRLDEFQLAAMTAVSKPNRFQRRAIATQQRKKTKETRRGYRRVSLSLANIDQPRKGQPMSRHTITRRLS